MGDMTLVIGNKNYSSWSLRPWLAMKMAGLDFREVVIPLYEGDYKKKILKYSPAGKVPILVDGPVTVWDSLAILEYLAEKFSEKNLWPTDKTIRAHARAISCEMHSGFMALRKECPMDIRKDPENKILSDQARIDVGRIQAIWSDTRRQYGQKGDFLFGKFTIADAMFAPVVFRFRTYGIQLDATARAYSGAMLGLPALQEWIQAAQEEPYVIAH
jgi:glutathione S-transferase